MLDPFDIFKIEKNGSVSWIRAVNDFERAKSYVNKVRGTATPADYLILNQRTGERIILKAATEQCEGQLKGRVATFSSTA